MPSSRTCLAAALLLLCGGAVQAQSEQTGWGSGYQMGTSYAGVSSGGVRLTFYCGDAAAAKANSAIKAGPYLMASLPRRDAADGLRSLEILIDGKATRIPVTAQSAGKTVELTWEPDRRFGVDAMRPVVQGLRRAGTLSLRAGVEARALPTAGAAEALAEDPLGCR